MKTVKVEAGVAREQHGHAKSSNFLIPELVAIGDAVCLNLQLGVEEEILGDSILSRVRGLISKGRVTSADVVRLALLNDALRVAEVAIAADEFVSDEEVGYALPLVQAAAKILAVFRELYTDLGQGASESVRTFLTVYRADKQLFGGACGKTRWLGLEIVRRVAEQTQDRSPLDRYSMLMLRLAEEIIALGGIRAPGEDIRNALDSQLGLRKLLAQAQAAAPGETEDPRVRAFCSPDSPDVFHAIAQAHHVWQCDPFDVELVHESTRTVFSRLLERASQERQQGTGRVLLVLGESGSGKTHLMRAFRERVHGGRSGYVGYLQMSSPAEDYGRYVLVNLLESLEKPYAAPHVQDSSLMCLSDALLMTPLTVAPEAGERLRNAELSNDEVCDLVFKLADDVVRDPRFSDLDVDLIRALLLLQRREPALYVRVMKLLRCEPLARRDLALIGELAPRTRPDDPLRLITQLGKLIARVDGGALVILLDQLEDILNFERSKESFVRAMDVVRHLCDNVSNALIVIACLSDVYGPLKQHLTQPVIARIERDPEPQRLTVHRTLLELEVMVERRLSFLYERHGVRHRSEEPHFPFPRTLLEDAASMTARDAFRLLRGYQQQCMRTGTLVPAARDFPSPRVSEPPAPVEVTDLAKLWADHRTSAQVQVPEEEEGLLELLSWALSSLREELPDRVEMRVELTDGELWVTPPDTGRGTIRACVRLTNKSSRGGGLAKQLEALIAAAREKHAVPVAVRCSGFGGGAGVAKHLGQMVKAGGRKVIAEDSSWRALLAYRTFKNVHLHQVGYPAFVSFERPLLHLDLLRMVLGLAALPESGVDVFASASVNVATTLVPAGYSPSPVRLPPRPRMAIPEPVKRPPDSHNGPLQIGHTISVNAQPALLDPEQLKRHAAFLGASGSGKTSLALNVIEQLAARGVGAILLDRKGDLATYADPEQWGANPGDPARARRKEELRQQIHVRLFTPGNPRGRSLRIRAVPEGLSALPAHERAQFAKFAAQGLGAMMGYKGTLKEQTNLAILAKAIEVIGQLSKRGDVGLREVIELIAEQDPSLMAELGHLDPSRHFTTLVTHLETLRLNHGALLESDDEPLRAEVLLGRDGSVPENKVPITIVSTKFLGDAERVDFWVSQLLVELARWCSRSPSPRLQALLFLDEADAYIPATRKPATKEPLQDLLKRARSGGLGVMLATQNPGDMDYKSRDNIGTWWIGRIGSKTAIEKMKPLLSECRTDVSSSLATASTGEFFQVTDGAVTRMRSERSLMDSVQLSEERILQVAELSSGKSGEKRRAG